MPSPTSWSSTTSIALSGFNQIDSLVGGTRWGYSTVTYSFPTASSYWSTNTTTGYGASSGSGEPWGQYYASLTIAQQAAFSSALQSWSNVANLTFALVTESSINVGDIRATFTDTPNAQAWSYRPLATAYAGDIWFGLRGTQAGSSWSLGSYQYQTVIHEIGHTLGLKHNFSTETTNGNVLPRWEDTRSYTIMSYSAEAADNTTSFSFEPTTPMILDIAAIQYVYGANNSFHAGDDTYSFSDSTTYHQTIWDAGGVDKIQYTGSRPSYISLRAGGGSDIGNTVYSQTQYGANISAVHNLWIAFGVTIENATGGLGDDTILGNDGNNQLEGGPGNDLLNGGAGNDYFDWNGSAGSDVFIGGLGDDVFVCNSTADLALEAIGEGFDTVWVSFDASLSSYLNVEMLRGYGSIGLKLTGDGGNNSIVGTSGNDKLTGAGGNDIVDGGNGIDTAVFSGNIANYRGVKTSTGWTLTSSSEGADTLTNIERLRFADATVALDISGVGGQAYRVYQAAFNRTPDAGGLGYWINSMDGGTSLNAVAAGFVGSAEFKAVYGANPTNAQIVAKLYDNVLHRPGETAGVNFWVNELNTGSRTVAEVLAGFSESAENQAGLIGVIGNGFSYTPYV